jgi:hypothetical protein
MSYSALDHTNSDQRVPVNALVVFSLAEQLHFGLSSFSHRDALTQQSTG